jgi:hypothetical protein
MLGNEDRNTPSSSESIPLEALSSVQSPVMRLSLEDPTVGRAQCLPTIRRPSESQASDQEGHVNDSLEDMAAASPPLGSSSRSTGSSTWWRSFPFALKRTY